MPLEPIRQIQAKETVYPFTLNQIPIAHPWALALHKKPPAQTKCNLARNQPRAAVPNPPRNVARVKKVVQLRRIAPQRRKIAQSNLIVAPNNALQVQTRNPAKNLPVINPIFLKQIVSAWFIPAPRKKNCRGFFMGFNQFETQGLNIFTPVSFISDSFRVTTVSPCSIAVIAIREVITGRFLHAPSDSAHARPHLRAIFASMVNILPWKRTGRSWLIQPLKRVFRFEWAILATPFSSSPKVRQLRKRVSSSCFCIHAIKVAKGLVL